MRFCPRVYECFMLLLLASYACLLYTPCFDSLMMRRSQENMKPCVLESTQSLSFRRTRFPSVEERVKIYMSNWYSPPCHDDERFYFSANGDEVRIDNMSVMPHITADKLFHLREEIVKFCARPVNDNTSSSLETYIDPKFISSMGMYCKDVLDVFDILHSLPDERALPVLMQFGDLHRSHVYGIVQVPHFKKFRSATDNLDCVLSLNCVSSPRPTLPAVHGAGNISQPIIWKLATHRHYKLLYNATKYDTPWYLKKNQAIFRGHLTGASKTFDKKKNPRENCESSLRCRLVLLHANSTLVDAKLTRLPKRYQIPDAIEEVDLLAPKVPVKYQLEYKALIMLEGNDVASGLKWALLSQSVVLMPKPKLTSWAMEERLEPWVHYVPLNEMAMDVEEKVQWIINHDEKARKIAHRATLWIQDLTYHPDAARDERLIKEEMIRRYRAHLAPLSKD